jgi:glutamyl-tRNA synthetase
MPAYESVSLWQHDNLEAIFKDMAGAAGVKPGELMFALRIMLIGEKHGPGVFDIAAIIGKEETIRRIKHGLELMK